MLVEDTYRGDLMEKGEELRLSLQTRKSSLYTGATVSSSGWGGIPWEHQCLKGGREGLKQN